METELEKRDGESRCADSGAPCSNRATSLGESTRNLAAPVTGGHVVTTDVVLVRMTGSIEDAVFLAQLVYWSDRCARKDRWVWKSAADWQRELGLSRCRVAAIAKRLSKLGLLETKLKKANGAPTTHYRIQTACLFNMIQATVTLILAEQHRSRDVETATIADITHGLQAERAMDCERTTQSITETSPDTTPCSTEISPPGVEAEGDSFSLAVCSSNAEERQSVQDAVGTEEQPDGLLQGQCLLRQEGAAARAGMPTAVRQALEHYRVQYKAALGHAPLISPGRDGAILKQLLEWDEIKNDVAKLNALIDRFLGVRTGWIAATDYSIIVLQRVVQELVRRPQEDSTEKDWGYEKYVDELVQRGDVQLRELSDPTVVARLKAEYSRIQEGAE